MPCRLFAWVCNNRSVVSLVSGFTITNLISTYKSHQNDDKVVLYHKRVEYGYSRSTIFQGSRNEVFSRVKTKINKPLSKKQQAQIESELFINGVWIPFFKENYKHGDFYYINKFNRYNCINIPSHQSGKMFNIHSQ